MENFCIEFKLGFLKKLFTNVIFDLVDLRSISAWNLKHERVKAIILVHVIDPLLASKRLL